jgi:ABC-2 type transport system permease protein
MLRNSMKVAKWEYKRNMKNKSFIIGLFLTPILFIVFFTLPSLFGSDDEEEEQKVYIYDELNVWESVQEVLPEEQFGNWETLDEKMDEETILAELEESENTAYIMLTEEALQNGSVKVYMGEEVDENFIYQTSILEKPILARQLENSGISSEEALALSQGVVFQQITADDVKEQTGEEISQDDPLKRIVPIAFGGIILFSIVITGMMIFQSASQEKKEKVAEIILSSLTPEELMQGKILGYFALGITQVAVWLGLIVPFLSTKIDIPIFEYLFVPETLLSVFIAILGYLLFASMFVSIGATVEDMNSTSNFQGFLFMFPFLPLILLGPILDNPNGVIAQAGTYFPLTTPGVLLIRLMMLDTWPWLEIVSALVILLLTIWLFMKLAGKIFKTGILMYGKDATPKEIWKWIRQ